MSIPTQLTNTARNFSRAAQKEHEGVVRILLGSYDVNPNTDGEYGQTPLSHAAQNRHEGVVKILLEWNDINPNTPDKDDRMPPSFATQDGIRESRGCYWDGAMSIPTLLTDMA